MLTNLIFALVGAVFTLAACRARVSSAVHKASFDSTIDKLTLQFKHKADIESVKDENAFLRNLLGSYKEFKEDMLKRIFDMPRRTNNLINARKDCHNLIDYVQWADNAVMVLQDTVVLEKTPESESKTWPIVLKFARQMEAKLEENRHKGDRAGWLKDSPEALLARVKEETEELQRVMTIELPVVDVWREAADVANMVMMTADSYEYSEEKRMGKKHTCKSCGGIRNDIYEGECVDCRH